MSISQLNARSIFTTSVSEIYEDKLTPKPMFTAMAKETTTKSKLVSVEVRRHNELIATDILVGTGGNRNQFSRSTLRMYEPPQYREYFDLTELEIYDRVFGTTGVEGNDLAQIIDTAAEKTAILRNKIVRSIEKQWSQVMDTGIVQLVNGDNIDYKRKAASLVNLTGAYWDGTTTTIIEQFRTGCNFLRTEGKSSSNEYMSVMGEDALDAFLASDEILNLGDQTYIKRVDINMPSEQMVGAVYHGTLSAGSYKIHIYTYPEYYDEYVGGVVTRKPYWDKKKVVLLPKAGFAFTTKYGGNKVLYKGGDAMPEYFGLADDKFLLNNFIDKRNSAHIFEIMSKPLAVPLSVDQIYTMQVLA